MKRLLGLLPIIFFFACGPAPEAVPPFIAITLQDPDGFVSQQADIFEVTNRAISEGNQIEKVFSVPAPEHALPTTFNIRFSEGLRGTNVDIEVRGLLNGQEVFFSSATAVADVSVITMTTQFCGDNQINTARGEECDDGDNNSDVLPDACRLACTLPACGDGAVDSGEECDDGPLNSDAVPNACRTVCLFSRCGDGVVDTGEECDDGNQVDADGCEADCSLPGCNNGIFEPEDFQDPNDPNLGGHCFVSHSTTTVEDIGLVTEIAAADMDNDGNQDLIVGTDQCEVKIIYGVGDGTFAGEFVLPSPGCAEFVAVGDFLGNQDGLPDIASGASVLNLPGFSIFKNLGGRNNFSTQTIPYPGSFQSLDEILLTDLNRDGKLNLVVLDVGVFSYQESGTVFNFQAVSTTPRGAAMDVADINNDLNPDILTVFSQGALSNFSFVNNVIGFPVFSFQLNYNPSNGKRDTMKLLDVNDDGFEDIVTFDNGTVKAIVFTGNGDGSFASSPIVILGDQPNGLEVGDFNKDGLIDPIYFNISAGLTGKSFSFFLSGIQPFQMVIVPVLNTTSLLSMVVADFDNDSIEDVVVIRADSNGNGFDSNAEVYLFDK